MDEWEARPHVQNFLKVVAKEQGIPEYTITSLTRTEKGEGYSGIIFMVSIKDNSTDKQLDLVIKSAYTEDEHRNFLPIEDSYANEIYFFTELKPALNRFVEQCGIVPMNYSAQCYSVHPEIGKEMLCIDNLKTFNFEVFDKKLILDDEHFSFIFKYYGRFHGYSFALKDRRPEEYARLVSPLRSVLEQFTTIPEGYFKKFLKGISDEIASKYLEVGEDEEIIKKFEKYQDGGIIDIFHDTVTDVCDNTTILHGDCWSNNMMFKYETSGNSRKLMDMRLLDLQIVRDGSPVCDLSYCLYSGGSKTEFDNLDKYFKIYYESLSMTLQAFGCDVKTIYPFHLLKEHWKRYARFGMAMTLAILKLKCTNKEDIVDVTDHIDRHEAARTKYNSQDFKKRVKDVLHHMSKMDAL